jgi:ribonuclease Z
MNPSEVLSGFSQALYSSWFWYAPARLLVDCGEGCATRLGSKCCTVEKVLLTHGHIDHIAGLPGLLWARAAGLSGQETPLEIWYPRGDEFVGDMRAFLEKTARRVPFALSWHELEAGEVVPLRSARRAQTFPTKHMKCGNSLGFKIVETRRQLKAEHAHLSGDELQTRARNGTLNDLMTQYDALKIAFCGDSLPVDAQHVAGSEILLHEATFLRARERREQMHSTLDEALEVGARACPKLLVLIHVSTRYGPREFESAARENAQKRELPFAVWCMYRDRLWPVYQPDLSSTDAA